MKMDSPRGQAEVAVAYLPRDSGEAAELVAVADPADLVERDPGAAAPTSRAYR
jgi:hypothetical protein